MNSLQAVKIAFDNTAQRYYEVAAQADMPGSTTEQRNEVEALEEALKALGAVLQMHGILTTRDAFNVYGLELPTAAEWFIDRHN